MFCYNLLQKTSLSRKSFILAGVQFWRSVRGRGSSTYQNELSSPYSSLVNGHGIGPFFGAITPWHKHRSRDAIAHRILLTDESHRGTKTHTYASTAEKAEINIKMHNICSGWSQINITARNRRRPAGNRRLSFEMAPKLTLRPWKNPYYVSLNYPWPLSMNSTESWNTIDAFIILDDKNPVIVLIFKHETLHNDLTYKSNLNRHIDGIKERYCTCVMI